jgi:hypothetical protein
MGTEAGADQPSIVWTGTEMVVTGVPSDATPVDFESAGSVPPQLLEESYQAFAYRPDTGAWRQLPPVPIRRGNGLTAAWTGSEVVMVTAFGPSADGPLRTKVAAAWNPTSDTWRDLGSPASAQPVNQPVEQPVRSPSGGPAVFWTGQRLLDTTHMAAWDPAGNQWTPMSFPPDLQSRFMHLSNARGTWDGHELVAVAWSTGPGLAWNATGTEYRELTGLPTAVAEQGPADMVAGSSPVIAATLLDDRILVVPVNGGAAASLDARTGQWRSEPAPALSPLGRTGSPRLRTIGGEAMFQPAGDNLPVVLRNGHWEPIPPEPAATGDCACLHTWVAAGDLLVSWISGGYDNETERYEPALAASVWDPHAQPVPGTSAPESSTAIPTDTLAPTSTVRQPADPPPTASTEPTTTKTPPTPAPPSEPTATD